MELICLRYSTVRPQSVIGGRTPIAVRWTGNEQEKTGLQTRFAA